MAAQQRVQQLEKDLGALAELVEIIKNPDAIVKAQETLRQQVKLTDDEFQKSSEARKLIADGERLKKELSEREAALVAAQDAHDDEVSAFNLRLAEHAQLVEANMDDFEKRQTLLDDGEAKLLAAQTELRMAREAHENSLQSERDVLAAQSARQDKRENEQKAEAERLNALRQDLDARAARVKAREQASEL